MRGLIERDREPGRTGWDEVCVCVCVCVCVKWVLWLYVWNLNIPWWDSWFHWKRCSKNHPKPKCWSGGRNTRPLCENSWFKRQTYIHLHVMWTQHFLHVYLSVPLCSSVFFILTEIIILLYFSALSCSQWNSTWHLKSGPDLGRFCPQQLSAFIVKYRCRKCWCSLTAA